MVPGDPHFTAMDIRDAIGQVADGQSVEPALVPLVRAALLGPCPTSDLGQQQFVVDVSGCGLFNVDTEELIWPRIIGDDIFDDVPLRIITAPEIWNETRQRWDEDRPRDWAAFVWRIAVPLCRRIGVVGAWEPLRGPGK